LPGGPAAAAACSPAAHALPQGPPRSPPAGPRACASESVSVMILMATKRRVTRSTALYTEPYAPRPGRGPGGVGGAVDGAAAGPRCIAEEGDPTAAPSCPQRALAAAAPAVAPSQRRPPISATISKRSATSSMASAPGGVRPARRVGVGAGGRGAPRRPGAAAARGERAARSVPRSPRARRTWLAAGLPQALGGIRLPTPPLQAAGRGHGAPRGAGWHAGWASPGRSWCVAMIMGYPYGLRPIETGASVISPAGKPRGRIPARAGFAAAPTGWACNLSGSGTPISSPAHPLLPHPPRVLHAAPPPRLRPRRGRPAHASAPWQRVAPRAWRSRSRWSSAPRSRRARAARRRRPWPARRRAASRGRCSSATSTSPSGRTPRSHPTWRCSARGARRAARAGFGWATLAGQHAARQRAAVLQCVASRGTRSRTRPGGSVSTRDPPTHCARRRPHAAAPAHPRRPAAPTDPQRARGRASVGAAADGGPDRRKDLQPGGQLPVPRGVGGA
jgi:hypothetical protein